MISLCVIFGLLGVGAVLVICGTLTKNRWGINVDPVSCPRCHTPFPEIRKPDNLRQTLWGGGTCLNCGTEVDKWGRELAPPSKQYAGFQNLPADESSPPRRKSQAKRAVAITVFYFVMRTTLSWSYVTAKVSHGEILAGIAPFLLEAVVFAVLFELTIQFILPMFTKRQSRMGTAGKR
jgi:hypothetical protein